MVIDKKYLPGRNKVFVFGSNRAGIHGAGAALTAYKYYSAVFKVGEGFFPCNPMMASASYAVPTKDKNMAVLPLPDVATGVQKFIEFSKTKPGLNFFVTRIGCGFAGYTDEQIAPMFKDAPSNCELPYGWREGGPWPQP